ncbi:hypothetical protein [Ulvibacter litoralis]|uniref:Uncharacterized protein n=1 Tax=Ulvibacter litoralis TaxID=227084 RepID=A0A1G7JI73_9FLAO|nr:hypothetical protein [Ulvibacter litoralis]GHC58898.1 hypothetical protein GCM10008083_24500 [Ulvibacter litoralis]SDF24620.1 hypothetical protein SAMN05421855_1151 [Ulvibacter litoralis]
MKRVLSIIILLFTLNTIAQSEKNKIIVVQKFYKDTLQTDYRKVKYEINKKANKVIRFDYSSAHISDTIIVRETTEYNFENGHFISSEHNNSRRISNIKTHKVGDTIFEKKTDYLTKKIYSKNKIVYASRLFPKQQSIPYNELKYIYNENDNLIKIQEKYNSDVNEEYKTIFEYKNGIVSRMTEFKKSGEKWIKEKIWRYELLTTNKLRKKIRKRINNLLLTNQFTETQW